MRRKTAMLTLTAAVALAACRAKSESEAMAVMTAEEHARMASGGGPADTGPALGREPVHLTFEQARAIGVTYTTVTRGPLKRTVRTVGQIAPAEPNLADITPKIDGFVDELFVNATGVSVRRGQPLLTIYSPMLVAAQQELLTANRLAASVDTSDGEAWRNAQELVAASRRRLAYWDISAEQIDGLERTGEVTKTLTLAAPFDGIVLEKMVVKGQAVMPGMKLYRLADLSLVWIEGEVFEQDLGFMRVGASARVEVAAYPGRSFAGRVGFVYPTVDEQSRAGRVRVALSNSGGLLKPGMYATLFFDVRVGADVLSLPAEAVVMTGERNLVFVVGKEGVLEPREVILGPRAGERLQILQGAAEGERVAASANFLIDAESRLATGAGMAGMPGMPGMEMEKPGKEQKRP
ncbi:MAG TPA: efflux RND transporter periplasmic adaptor subunit [Gemmatimonadales bacterium]|nr:efflux RND transporter periplasmic adaptor subunit [Gemmatimonadales bacterium]